MACEGFAQVPWEGAETIHMLCVAELGVPRAYPSQGRIWNKVLVERGLQNIHKLSSSLQLHVRRTPDLRSLSNGRQVSGPQPGAGDKEALRCPLTLEQHIQVSQLLPMEPTRGLFPNPPTFHPFISAICCDLLFLEDAIIFSGKNKYACSVNQSSLTLW